VQGEAEVERDGETFLLQANESTVIPQNAKHRLANPGKTLLLLIEVQMGERVDENDIIRY
ncbi:MAG: cupin domain-containing protein, partial [Nitrospinaceae bacterium]|nr:cupin domain-containing protein [Nitrospinaceae bacterium]NIR57837.1 cupin domain-containing protein [Nitrospinaceae bacterium]NIS88300.1 cupin domain-containing protein [Nitrospinaceae bacterium]NIT85178.1 cupin domain-containing protein [Nitrospinaceae bacterium]NIU47331.1 cupin domain-containing protein [Nitrospinaceae bacterium]